MHGSLARPAALALVLALTACGPFYARQHADQNIITREEIEQNHFRNAYEAVVALHSNWLVRKPKSASNGRVVGVRVDQNSMCCEPGDVLGVIEAQRIQYIRYWDPASATVRWGVGHTNGVIQVSTQAM